MTSQQIRTPPQLVAMGDDALREAAAAVQKAEKAYVLCSPNTGMNLFYTRFLRATSELLTLPPSCLAIGLLPCPLLAKMSTAEGSARQIAIARV